MKLKVGTILTAVGAAVGVLGAIAMGIKLKMTVSPDMHEVLIYRELFVVSAVLLILGAFFGRRERQENAERNAESPKELGGPSQIPLETHRELDQSRTRER